MQASPEERVRFFDNFLEQIHAADSQWSASKTPTSGGGALYTGEARLFWFVISETGNLYQGSDIFQVADFNGGFTMSGEPILAPLFRVEGGRFIPIYDNLRTYWASITGD